MNFLVCGAIRSITSAVADLHSKILDARPDPGWSKFFQFHAVFGKIWQNHMLATPGELAPPPRGYPGSATPVRLLVFFSFLYILNFTQEELLLPPANEVWVKIVFLHLSVSHSVHSGHRSGRYASYWNTYLFIK